MNNKRLYRSCKNRIIGGVAGGLAEYLDVDVNLVRLITLLIILSGAGLVAYIVAWILIPIDPECEEKRDGVDEIKESVEQMANEFKKAFKETKTKKRGESTNWFGWILIVLGAFFLLESIVGFNIWTHFWPVVIILLGFALIARGFEK